MTTATAEKTNGQVKANAIAKKEVIDIVSERIRTLQERRQLHLPPNYSAENALKAAWLALQEVTDKDGRRALDVCDRTSIMNSLLKMVIQGLNPAKNQCYFVVFGTKLVLMRSYFGSIHVAKSVDERIEDIVLMCMKAMSSNTKSSGKNQNNYTQTKTREHRESENQGCLCNGHL